MEMKNPYVAFFDLDRTIAATNSGYALFRAAHDSGMLKNKDLLRPLLMLLLYKTGLRPADSIIKVLGKMLKDSDEEKFNDLADLAARKYILDSVFPGAKMEIDLHRQLNAHTVILSSAVEGICRPVASYLSFDTIICTVMESKNGRLTGASSGEYCYGEEKRRRLTEFCMKNGLSTESAFYYADSFSDISALMAVGNPVCINPDRKLASHARRAGWQVRSWQE